MTFATLTPPLDLEPVDDRPPRWQDRRNCAGCDPNIFFPARGATADVLAAKAVCAGCVVRAECLDYGIGEREGIWGGLSARERRRMRRSVNQPRAEARRLTS